MNWFDNIFDNENKFTFIHSTNNEKIAKSICNLGFFGYNYLTNTADEVNINTFEFWYNYRKNYGDFIIVIQIQKDILIKELYLSKTSEKIINKIKYIINDQDILFDFMIKPKYIRGYFKRIGKIFIVNELFDYS